MRVLLPCVEKCWHPHISRPEVCKLIHGFLKVFFCLLEASGKREKLVAIRAPPIPRITLPNAQPSKLYECKWLSQLTGNKLHKSNLGWNLTCRRWQTCNRGEYTFLGSSGREELTHKGKHKIQIPWTWGECEGYFGKFHLGASCRRQLSQDTPPWMGAITTWSRQRAGSLDQDMPSVCKVCKPTLTAPAIYCTQLPT